RDRGADVSLGRAVVGAILEAEVGRDCNREQDPDDDDDDEELDEREPLLASEPLTNACQCSSPWSRLPAHDTSSLWSGLRTTPFWGICTPAVRDVHRCEPRKERRSAVSRAPSNSNDLGSFAMMTLSATA